MPYVICFTNLADDQIPKDFEEWISKLVSKVLDKPLERVNTILTTGVRMFRLGNSSPTMTVQIHSIDVFQKGNNPTYTEKLNKAIKEKVNLPADRTLNRFITDIVHGLKNRDKAQTNLHPLHVVPTQYKYTGDGGLSVPCPCGLKREWPFIISQ